MTCKTGTTLRHQLLAKRTKKFGTTDRTMGKAQRAEAVRQAAAIRHLLGAA